MIFANTSRISEPEPIPEPGSDAEATENEAPPWSDNDSIYFQAPLYCPLPIQSIVSIQRRRSLARRPGWN